uniref:Uncharacterized protein n=1 Tax=Glossina brevipalpis TaxID=37001 RepID=A0A1A9W4I8_9MUSC
MEEKNSNILLLLKLSSSPWVPLCGFNHFKWSRLSKQRHSKVFRRSFDWSFHSDKVQTLFPF